ncbi:SDR family NAD(P)-dependent oxidoreductase [uncultured Sphingobacterium sp.]|uniref:SDR family NAD(P)-dependent oxidoreductase n=1 Tax=uncultured Sphingobacterium sp. TaxID=182688 RepID=UPI00374837A7
MSKIVFITGASKGFGKLWAEALLQRGDKVAASARNITALAELKAAYGDNLLAVKLDVNSRENVFSAVNKIKDHFGRIDVLINNAGFGLFGTTEETSEQQARDQMETNFFGSLWVAQAVLPIMRAQKSGHIIQVSSFLGLTTIPLLGLYNASKFAIEGLIETIGLETAHLGIKTTLIEPNGFATDWAGASAVQTSSEITDYEPVRAAFAATGDNPDTWGNPEATVAPVLNIIDNENPPKRILFGKIAYQVINDVYTKRLEDIQSWKEVSIAAHGH